MANSDEISVIRARCQLQFRSNWYNPELGRLAQADTVVPGGVQGYDRYAYANNDPVGLSDPTGHYGQCRDEDSGYKCKHIRQNQQKKNQEDWAKEAARKAQMAALKALIRQYMQNITMSTQAPTGSANPPLVFDPGRVKDDDTTWNSFRGFTRWSLFDHIAFGGEWPFTLATSDPLYNARVTLTPGGWLGNDDLIVTPLDRGMAGPTVWANSSGAGISTGLVIQDSTTFRENLGMSFEDGDLRISYDMEGDQDLGFGGLYSKIGTEVSIHHPGTTLALGLVVVGATLPWSAPVIAPVACKAAGMC